MSAMDKVTSSTEMFNNSPRLAGAEQRRWKDNTVKRNVVFSHEIVQLHLVFQNTITYYKTVYQKHKNNHSLITTLGFADQEHWNEMSHLTCNRSV